MWTPIKLKRDRKARSPLDAGWYCYDTEKLSADPSSRRRTKQESQHECDRRNLKIHPQPRSHDPFQKGWMTYAYLTREGDPDPRHRDYNFKSFFNDDSASILHQARTIMRDHPDVNLGSYVMAIWPGDLDEGRALHGPTKPLWYIFQGGIVEEIA